MSRECALLAEEMDNAIGRVGATPLTSPDSVTLEAKQGAVAHCAGGRALVYAAGRQ